MEQNQPFSPAPSAQKDGWPWPYPGQEDLSGEMPQAERLLRPAGDLFGQMADSNQIPRWDQPPCPKGRLTASLPRVGRAASLPVPPEKGRGMLFLGSCQPNFRSSPCQVRETHWPWWRDENAAEAWLGTHRPCPGAVLWHQVLPASHPRDWWAAWGPQHSIRHWDRHRKWHCPSGARKEGMRFLLLNSSGKQARKSGGNGGGCSTGRGGWQKLVFSFIVKRSWRL